jgi:hypothetical protein
LCCYSVFQWLVVMWATYAPSCSSGLVTQDNFLLASSH